MDKVCHMTSVHKRYDIRIFQKECSSLAEAGYDVSLVVCDDLEDEERNGVHIISTHYIPKNRLDRMRKGANLVFVKAQSVDAELYHLHDPELLPTANKLARQGKKVIFDSHEIYYYQIKLKSYFAKPVGNLIAAAYKSYEKHILSRLDAVIVPCTVNGENYFEHIAKRTVFINNLPKNSFVQYVPYEEKSLPVKCCYAGSLSLSRGLNEMLQASQDTNTKLILAGPLDNLPEEAQNQVWQKLDDERIDFRGVVDREQVDQIYEEAHIGLSLLHNAGQYNLADNLPTKAYEYMLAGIPLVISRQRPSERFIEQYKVGLLVDSENQTEIDNAIIYLKNHLDEAKEMGARGRKIVLENFCWEKEFDKLLALYKDLL